MSQAPASKCIISHTNCILNKYKPKYPDFTRSRQPPTTALTDTPTPKSVLLQKLKARCCEKDLRKLLPWLASLPNNEVEPLNMMPDDASGKLLVRLGSCKSLMLANFLILFYRCADSSRFGSGISYRGSHRQKPWRYPIQGNWASCLAWPRLAV